MSNRATRRANAARSRQDRIANFRERAGGGGYETSLLPVGEHRPQDGAAIRDWFLREPVSKPYCFACKAEFTPATRRPGGFLTARSIRQPTAGVAVSAICEECFGKSPEIVEASALDCLHRNLKIKI